MACIMKKCAITNDEERMITCWLCNGLCHIKCCGLSGLISDSLSKNNGLAWRCNDCKKISTTFYHFFQSNKSRLLEMQEEANKLCDKISNYAKLFDEFTSLDSLKSPIQMSPKRKRSARLNNKEKLTEPSVASFLPSSPLIPESATSAANCCGPALLNKTSVTSSDVPTNSTLKNVKVPKATRKNTFVNNMSAADEPNHQNNQNASESVNCMIMENDCAARSELRVIPPKKQIFISRFAFDTTANEIDSYIRSKIDKNVDINVHKFTYSQTRTITSFKLTVPFEIFNTILDTTFWPEHVLVREFKQNVNRHPNNVAYLPKHQSTYPKN